MLSYELKLDSPEAQLLSNAVERQLRDILLADYDEDGALVRYVVAMVSHKQSLEIVAQQLEEFLEHNARSFAEWLQRHVAENRGVYDASLKQQQPQRPSRAASERVAADDETRGDGRGEGRGGPNGRTPGPSAREEEGATPREPRADARAGARGPARSHPRGDARRSSLDDAAAPTREERADRSRPARAPSPERGARGSGVGGVRGRERSRSPRAPRPSRIFGLAMRSAGAPAAPAAPAGAPAAARGVATATAPAVAAPATAAPPPAEADAVLSSFAAAMARSVSAAAAGSGQLAAMMPSPFIDENGAPLDDAMAIDAAPQPLDVQAELAGLRAAVLAMASTMDASSGLGANPPGTLPYLLNPPAAAAAAGGGEIDPKSVVITNVHFNAAPEEVGRHIMQCSGEQVVRVTILKNRLGFPKGYCYVELLNPDGASAILRLSGTEFMGRKLRVIPKTKTPPPKPGWGAPFMHSPFHPLPLFQPRWGQGPRGRPWGGGRGPPGLGGSARGRGRGRGRGWGARGRGGADVWIRGISDVKPSSLQQYTRQPLWLPDGPLDMGNGDGGVADMEN